MIALVVVTVDLFLLVAELYNRSKTLDVVGFIGCEVLLEALLVVLGYDVVMVVMVVGSVVAVVDDGEE